MKRLISVLVLAFSFAVFAQGSAAPAETEKAAAEKSEKGEKHEKEGEKKPEMAK